MLRHHPHLNLRCGLFYAYDETYENYLTYFYPNSVSADDMNFILSVRNHKSLGFAYKLNDYEFEQTKILNFGLIDE